MSWSAPLNFIQKNYSTKFNNRTATARSYIITGILICEYETLSGIHEIDDRRNVAIEFARDYLHTRMFDDTKMQ